MRFSIICPSFLGEYKTAASNLETKIVRAIDSVIAQHFEDWELIVVSDGCEKTIEIVKPYVYEFLPKIRLIQIPKQPMWSGSVRNAGIFKAEGEIITYLDVDDKLGADHLQIINDNFGDNDWVYYNDWNGKTMQQNNSRLVLGSCGTSSISHKRSLNVYWKSDTYAHDWIFIRTLMETSANYAKIDTPQYYICHVPGIGAYDV